MGQVSNLPGLPFVEFAPGFLNTDYRRTREWLWVCVEKPTHFLNTPPHLRDLVFISLRRDDRERQRAGGLDPPDLALR